MNEKSRKMDEKVMFERKVVEGGDKKVNEKDFKAENLHIENENEDEMAKGKKKPVKKKAKKKTPKRGRTSSSRIKR